MELFSDKYTLNIDEIRIFSLLKDVHIARRGMTGGVVVMNGIRLQIFHQSQRISVLPLLFYEDVVSSCKCRCFQ
jgi:hypothetical protein